MRKAKKFVINTIILTTTSIILRVVNVSFTVYIAGKIGAEGMGLYQLISTVYILAFTFATSGIGLATTRLVAEELARGSRSGAKMAVRKCIRYSLFCSTCTVILLCSGAKFIAVHWLHGKISAASIYALACSLPFLAMSTVLSGYFTAVRRVAKSASAQLFEPFAKIGIAVHLAKLIAPQNLDHACLALVAAGAIAEILSFGYLFFLYLLDKKKYARNEGYEKNQAAKGLTSKMFSIAIPVAVSSLIRAALNTYKQVIIPTGLEKSGMSCDDSIAIYGMIRGMALPVIMFPSALLAAFSSLLIPEIAESYVQERRVRINYITARIFKVTLLFAVCVGGIFTAFSEELSLAIYKSSDVAFFLKVFGPLIVIMYLDDIVDAVLKGLNEQVNVVRINIYDTIISIILLYILLPLYGVNGYIIAFFASEIFNSFLSIRRLIKKRYFKMKFVSWVALPAFSMMISIVITKMLVADQLVVSVAAATGIYMLILCILGIVTKEDFAL